MNLRVRTVIPGADMVPTGGNALPEAFERAFWPPRGGAEAAFRALSRTLRAAKMEVDTVVRQRLPSRSLFPPKRALLAVHLPCCVLLTPLPAPLVQAFHLVGELRGHSEDVRAVALAGPHGVATTSRDKTLRTWPVDGNAQLRGEGTVFVGHTDFVGPVVWAPPGLLPVAPEGALVTGSRDTTVLLWHPTAAVTLQRLAGHSLQVRAAHADEMQHLRRVLDTRRALVRPGTVSRSHLA